MNKKYELTSETKIIMVGNEAIKVHRIKALIDISEDVKAGSLGGWVESEDNLLQSRSCWIFDNSACCGNAKIYGNAILKNNSICCENAGLNGNAIIDSSCIKGESRIRIGAIVKGSTIGGTADIAKSYVFNSNIESGKIKNVSIIKNNVWKIKFTEVK